MKNRTLVAGLMAILTAFSAGNAAALEQGDWLLRLGATYVDPNDDSGAVKNSMGPILPNTGVDVDGATSLGITLEYMVTGNLGVELLAAWPFKHDIDGDGSLSGLDIGDTKHLPPTLSLNYHFMPKNNIRPYVGAGVNYTYFFDENLSSDLKSLGYHDLELDDSWGWALQAGVDVDINDKWFVNGSVRYIDIDTDAKISNQHMQGEFGPVLRTDVDIDPWIYSLMIGTSF
jgi:outer membrane protein